MIEMRWSGLLLAAILFLPLAGCGGGPTVVFPEPRKTVDDDEEAPPPPKASTPANAKQAVSQAAKGSASPTAKGDPATRADAIADAATAANQGQAASDDQGNFFAVPALPVASQAARPSDVSRWTHDDYRAAKEAGDPRLVQAVLHVNRSSPNVAENARLLVELLAPASQTNPAAPQAPLRGLAQAAVVKLGENGSPEARKALKEIVLGKIKTDADDKAITVAALTALVENIDSDTEGVLVAVITMPEAVRPPGRGTLAPDVLQREGLTLVRNIAAPRLRMRLAEYLLSGDAPAVLRAQLMPILMEQRPENLEAQTLLALSDALPSESVVLLQRNLAAHARRSIDDLMGVVDPQVPRGVLASTTGFSPTSAGRAASLQIAEMLWSDRFLEALMKYLDDVASPAEQADAWALAASIPHDSLRALVRERLHRNWDDGEKLARAPQFSALQAHDPGMLIVLKSLPREELSTKNPVRRGAESNPTAARNLREWKAKQAWMTASMDMVLALAKRLEQAGRAAKQSRTSQSTSLVATRPLNSADDFDRLLDEQRNANSNAVVEDRDEGNRTGQLPQGLPLPLDLPPKAEIDIQHSIRWPEQLEGISSPISPFVLHYARLELEEQPGKVLIHFERQLQRATQHPIDNGRWIDSVSRPAPGKLRSIDVVVRRARPSPVEGTVSRNTVEPLIVEILWIEIADFLAEAT